MRDYLLFCTYCSSYTLLHSYQKETGTFLGEYSLLHNDYTRNSVVLNKFLLSHLGHSLRMVPSKTEEYREAICNAKRFLENDIDKYVEESRALRTYQEQNAKSERAIGRVQLHILKELLQYELENITRTRASTPAEGQVLLGQELGIKKALGLTQRVLADKQLA